MRSRVIGIRAFKIRYGRKVEIFGLGGSVAISMYYYYFAAGSWKGSILKRGSRVTMPWLCGRRSAKDRGQT